MRISVRKCGESAACLFVLAILVFQMGHALARQNDRQKTQGQTAKEQPAGAQAAGPQKAAPGEKAESKPAADYSKEAAVVEELRKSTRFENDGTGTDDLYARIRVQSASAVHDWGQLIFNYNSASERLKVVHLRVYKPDGKVVTAGEDAIQDLSSPVEQDAPVYSDLRQIHLTVPGLDAGDTLEYELHTEMTSPVVPGQFFLDWNFFKDRVALAETLELNVPKAREMRVEMGPDQKPPEIREDGERKIYTWHAAQLEGSEEKSADEKKEKKKKKPEEVQDDVMLSSFENWEQVGVWYAGLQRPRASATDSVKAKADELVKGRATAEAKTKAIYDYVSQNIRYVSLSFGVGRYQPHAASEVLANQYGDCKDKATLLIAMLGAEGIESYPVLIHSSKKLDEAMPSPAQFDHLINVVMVDGKPVWADSTPGATPFGYLMPPLRDKEALTIPPAGKAELEHSPAAPPFIGRSISELKGKVDANGKLTGDLRYEDSSDSGVTVRLALQLIPETRLAEIAKYIGKGVIGVDDAQVTDSHFDGIKDIEAPIVLHLHISAEGFADATKKNILLAMGTPNDLGSKLRQFDKDSKDPLKLGTPATSTETWKLEIPEAWKASLPVPVHVTRDYGEFVSSYRMEGHTAIAERTVSIRQPEVPNSRYDDVRAFLNAVNADAEQKLNIENSAPVSADAGGAAVDDEDALYDKASHAFNARNIPLATRLYKQLLDKNTDYKGAWNELGRCYLVARSYGEATLAFQKAIEKNPYDQYANANLGLAYEGNGQYEEATKAFQKALEVNPLDKFAHRELGLLYLKERKYDPARKELEVAIQVAPEQTALYVSLGDAYLGAGQDADAMKAFDKALEQHPEPLYWNNIAYTLSEHGVHLDKAQVYADNAVRTVEAQLEGATLATAGPAPAGQMTSLGAYWDTLAWIFYKQGNLAGAEEYLLASWSLTDDATVADHLGRLYEKEGKRDAAIESYELAMLCRAPDPETRGRLAALIGKDKVDAAVDKARAKLAERRTMKLPNPHNLNGDGEVWLLIGPGPAIEDVRFISGEDSLKGIEPAIREGKPAVEIPKGSTTKLLVRAAVSCGKLVHACDVVDISTEMTLLEAYQAAGGVQQNSQ